MNFNELQDKIKNPDDVTDLYDPRDIESNKGLAAVACIPILFWIPLVSGNSPFARFYANQGLTNLILGIALGIAGTILSVILALIPILGAILMVIVHLITWAVPLAAFIFSLVNALNGKAKPIPLIGTLINPFK